MLASIPLFSGLDARTREVVEQHSALRALRENTVVNQKGDESGILQGCCPRAGSLRYGPDGARSTAATLGSPTCSSSAARCSRNPASPGFRAMSLESPSIAS